SWRWEAAPRGGSSAPRHTWRAPTSPLRWGASGRANAPYSIPLLDRECILSCGPMTIPGDHPPEDTVGARWQWWQEHLKERDIRCVYVPIVLVEPLAVHGLHLQAAKGCLQSAIEPDAHPGWGDCHRGAHWWLGALGQGMAPGVPGRQADQHDITEGDDGRGRVHAPHPPQGKSGRPRLWGNRSSMNRCTSPRTPTFFPLRVLIGMVASRPSWRYFPNQMNPGLTVPVVWPLQSRFRQVSSATSTRGIIRLNGVPSPTSLTKACRYCRLYCSATPQLSVIGLRSISCVISPLLGSSRSVTVCRRVGTCAANTPVSANGLR